MKNFLKRMMVALLVAIMLLISAPLNDFVGTDTLELFDVFTEAKAKSYITSSSYAQGTNYTSSKALASKLNTIFSGDIDIYSNRGCTTEVSMPLGKNMGMDTEYAVKSNVTGNKFYGYQCYIYANAVYNKLFNECPYHGTSFSHSKVVVSGGSSSVSYNTFNNAGVKCGAYMRTTTSSNGAYDGNNGHSLIILSYDSNYISYLEGNGDGNGLIRIAKMTWSEFNRGQLSGRSRYVAHIVQPIDSYYDSLYSESENNYTYSFVFDANGGILDTDGSFTVKYDQAFTVSNTSCARTGYTFEGWAVKRNNDSKWYISGRGWCTESQIESNGYVVKIYNNNDNLTLDNSWINGVSGDCSYTFYAQWSPNESVITFDLNYSGMNANYFCTPCNEITVNGITYIYDASNDTVTLNGATVQTVTQIGVVPFWVDLGDVYTASCYYISGSVTNGELCYDVCGKDGYRLENRKYLSCKNSNSSATWNFTEYDSTDEERENAAGSYLKLWAYNSTGGEGTVVFDNYKIRIKLEKGSTATEYSPSRQTVSVDETFAGLPQVERGGYIFNGWYTKATDGEKITETTVCTYDDYITLYAQWTPYEWVTTFNLNYNNVGANLFRSPCDEITVSGITYSYDEKTEILTLNGTTSQDVIQIGSIPFWVYVGDTYTASCSYVSGSITNGELCYDVCGKDGYRLSNRKYLVCKNTDTSVIWTFTVADSTNTETENAAGSFIKLWIDNNTTDTDVVFDNYKVKLKLERGSSATGYSPARKVLETGNISGKLPNVSRTGYTFSGWYTHPTSGTIITDSSIFTSNEYKTLYAHWTANSYTIKFNGNGSTSGSMSNLSMTYGTAKKLTANTFAKNYCQFIGWNTKADGSGTTYTDELSVNNLTSTNGATVTLYAQWKYIPFTVKDSCTLIYDEENKFIYGEDLFSMDSSLLADQFSNENISVELTDRNQIGTGALVHLKEDNASYDTLSVVIFGDVNGDSWYDGQDAVLVSCLANGMLTQNDVSEAVYMAADCNHDGVIDEADVTLLNEAGTLLTSVDQSKSAEVLLKASSAYVEYLEIIDQSPEIEIEDVTDVDNISEQKSNIAEINIIEMIFVFLKSIFKMLIAYIPVPLK